MGALLKTKLSLLKNKPKKKDERVGTTLLYSRF